MIGISYQSRDDIDQKVEATSMTGMLYLGDILQLVINRLNYRSLAQHQLVFHDLVGYLESIQFWGRLRPFPFGGVFKNMVATPAIRGFSSPTASQLLRFLALLSADPSKGCE